MAPRDITNCVRRPAAAKQITPTAPRRVLKKAPEDDCAPTVAVVTPDSRTSAWRGDPATHLPEEVFHLVLAPARQREDEVEDLFWQVRRRVAAPRVAGAPFRRDHSAVV